MSMVKQPSSGGAVTEREGENRSRTSWLFGVVVVVAASVGLGVWWLATDDGDGESTSVTGSEVCLFERETDQGAVFLCEVTSSDPRVSGQRTVWLHEWDQTTGEMTATVTLANDGGSWTGSSTGYDDPSGASNPGEDYAEGVLIGDGDYAGLQFVERVEFGSSEGEPSQITGTIEPTT